MQTLVTAIRSTGATQPVLVGGLDFADDLSQWATHAPNDPLNQEAASFHNYMGKECDNEACWNSEVAPIAASVPVVTGEFDEDNFLEPKCPAKTPSTFDQSYMSWADGRGVSYLAWGWLVESQEEKDAEGCSAFYLIEDYGGTPAAPNGTALHEHLLALPPGGLTSAPAASAPPGPGAPAGGRPAPAVLPALTLKGFAAAVRRGGTRVAFKLHSAQSCSGTLSGQTVGAYAASGSGRARHRVSLGSVRFTLQAGRAKTVVLTLAKRARRLLAARHSLKVQIVVALSGPGFRTTVSRHTLVLRMAGAHAHGGH